MVARGAHVQARNSRGDSALFEACKSGSAEIVRILINHGADPNASVYDGTTPLMVAAGMNSSEVVGELLAHGADPSVRNKDGETAVSLAQSLRELYPEADKKIRLIQAYIKPRNSSVNQTMISEQIRR